MPVVGTVTAKDTFNGYMGVMTNIKVLSGSASLPDTAFIFCIDRFAYFPTAGSAHQYTLSDSFEQVMANQKDLVEILFELRQVLCVKG